MARPRGRQFGRTQKRQSTWIGQADQDVIAVGSGSSVIISSFSPSGAGLLHPTIARTRGIVYVAPQSFAADLGPGGAYGVCIVSDEAFAAGATSIPRPFTDSNWGGWFVWRSFRHQLEFGDNSGKMQWQGSTEVDSKAMRKVGDNETIVMMAESQTGAINVAMHLRMLMLLS